MAVPSESYMLLHGGMDADQSTIYTGDNSGTQNLIKIGDTIKITGTVSNNGIFTVTDISDGGASLNTDNDVYYVLKGNSIVNEDDTSKEVTIEVIRAPGDKLVALGDVDAAGGVDVWSNNATTDYAGVSPADADGWTTSAISPTLDGHDAKYIYHFADEALRVCNTNPQNTTNVRWYGFIQRHQFAYAGVDASDSTKGHGLVFSEWQDHPNILRPPRVTGGFSYAYVNSADTGGGSGTNPTLGDDPHLATDATNYFSENRGVATTKQAGIDSDFSGSPANIQLNGAHNTTTQDFTFENDNATANVLDQSVAGEVITIDEALGTAPKEYLFCKKTSGATGTTITYTRSYGGTLGDTAPDTYGDQDTPIINRGLGFNIGVSDGTATGTWEAATYEFYQSFIYDGNQESIPVKMGDGEATTGVVAGTHTAAGGKSLRVSVYADLAYSGRISGGRIYIRKQNSDDDLILLVDIDIVKGIRTSIDGDHNNWTYETGKGYYVTADATGNAVNPNLDTYNTINGFAPDVRFVSIGSKNESYQTSVVAGRRAFIANVRTFGFTGELERFGDRIMYSEVNKFDTFLPDNFIDVSKGDYGEYTALEVYADRLLAFKHNLIHIINITNPSPSNWYLEDTIKYYGVTFPFSVTRTEYGCAWVNEAGCFLYDGSRVRNLVEKKLDISSPANSSAGAWYLQGRGSANRKAPMIGYDAMSNSLIVQRDPRDGSANTNQTYIYDFDSGGWVYNTTMFTNDETSTNFVTDWNNNLTIGINVTGDTGNVEFFKYLPIPATSTGQEIITRDIDFGQPGLTKKIYKVIVTYKSNGSITTPFTYAIDGIQNFAGAGGGTFTGNFADTSGVWDVVALTPSSIISCQSIQIKFAPGNGVFEINDITIEYRVLQSKAYS